MLGHYSLEINGEKINPKQKENANIDIKSEKKQNMTEDPFILDAS